MEGLEAVNVDTMKYFQGLPMKKMKEGVLEKL